MPRAWAARGQYSAKRNAAWALEGETLTCSWVGSCLARPLALERGGERGSLAVAGQAWRAAQTPGSGMGCGRRTCGTQPDRTG